MYNSVIELIDIVNYVGDFKRPFAEGSEILKCNHIIEFHCVESINDSIKIKALCLQTSDLNGKPHELEVTKSTVNNIVQLSAKCTCKAGSGKCKHIAGLMLKLQKTPEEDLNVLSCTDIPQQWGKSGLHTKEMHKPVPIKEFCHVKPLVSVYEKSLPDDLPEEMQQDCEHLFLTEFPQSAYTIHRHGRHEPRLPENVQLLCNDLDMVENFIISNNTIFFNELERLMLINNSCKDDITFFYSHIAIEKEQAKDIYIKTLNQTGPYWHKVRQLRITGTSAYQYFTYYKGKKQDWDTKVETMFFPKFAGNYATRYGHKNEKNALAVFEKQYGSIQIQVGFIININCPWFGFSPDGFFKCGSEIFLLEVKCPLEGKQYCGSDLITRLKYCCVVQGKLLLKKKHTYYAQIQFGLMLCNLKLCHLIIYATLDDSIIIINVEFDAEFCKDLYNCLSNVYFQHILPRLKNLNT